MRIEKEREIINLDKKGIGDGSSVQYTVSLLLLRGLGQSGTHGSSTEQWISDGIMPKDVDICIM